MRLLLKALPQKVRMFSLPRSGWGASASSTRHLGGCLPRRGLASKGACGLPPPGPFARPTHYLGAQKCLLTGAQEHEAVEGRFLISLVLRSNLLASGQQARPGPQKKAALRIVVPVEPSQRVGGDAVCKRRFGNSSHFLAFVSGH